MFPFPQCTLTDHKINIYCLTNSKVYTLNLFLANIPVCFNAFQYSALILVEL